MGPRGGNVERQTAEAEHIGPDYTGDNISAKRVAAYHWDGSEWGRSPTAFLNLPYDEIILTYTDDTKETLSTIVTKLGGATQQTVTYTEPTPESERYIKS